MLGVIAACLACSMQFKGGQGVCGRAAPACSNPAMRAAGVWLLVAHGAASFVLGLGQGSVFGRDWVEGWSGLSWESTSCDGESETASSATSSSAADLLLGLGGCDGVGLLAGWLGLPLAAWLGAALVVLVTIWAASMAARWDRQRKRASDEEARLLFDTRLG